MANLTSAEFRVYFDEFSDVSAAKLAAYLGLAEGRVPASVWGTNAKYATALLTAHLLAAAGGTGGSGGGTGGPVTSEDLGEASRSYGKLGVAGSADETLLTTRYGAEFIQLRRETVVSGMATGSATLPPVEGQR